MRKRPDNGIRGAELQHLCNESTYFGYINCIKN